MIDKFANMPNEIKQQHFDKLNAYRKKLFKEPDLRQLFIEMTVNCNEHCLHCGSNCSIDAEVDKPISDLEILYCLTDLKESLKKDNKSLPFIAITGGEPLLRPNVLNLMKIIKSLGYNWGMTSNGLLINEIVARQLKESGISTISISLDGTKEVHNWFRQNKSAYDLTIKAIKNLSRQGFKDVMVTTVVHPKNIDELDEIKKIVLSTGCSTWRITTLDPIGRALNNENLYLNNEQYKYMLDYVVKECEKDDINVITGCNYYLGLDYERKVRPWYFLCQAGLTVASIQYNGNISTCLDLARRKEFVFGNIKNDNLYDIWMNKFEIFRKDRDFKNSECENCSELKNCHGSGWHTWDLDNNKPRFCLYNSIIGI